MFHMQIVVVYLVILQVSALPPISTSFQKDVDSRPFPTPILLPQCTPQFIVIPEYKPTSESIFANAPSVTLFTKKFLETINSSDILRELFDLSQTTAKQFADYAREAIAPNIDVLTLPILSNDYANTAANYLYVTGVLTIDNAEEIALSYTQCLTESAKVKMNSDPTPKFPVLFDGVDILLSVVGNLERFLTDLGFKNAVKTLPEFAFRALTPNFDVLTLPILSNIYANTAANYLYVTGVLTIDNAEKIALSYTQRLTESAKVKMNSDPTSKFPALFDGVDFLLSVVGYSKRNAVTLCYYIGNEWFLAALNYRGL